MKKEKVIVQGLPSLRMPQDSRMFKHLLSTAIGIKGQQKSTVIPWTARRSNQPIRKEISPECSLEGLMLRLKLPILWPSDAKNWLLGKDPDAGKDWRQEEKGTTEDEMVGWHHQLDGLEFEQVLGVGDEQRSLVCYIVHGVTKRWTQLSDWTELRTTKFPLWILTNICE